MSGPLLLHQTTAYHLKSFITSKPHGLLILGQPGSGKQAIAEKYIQEVLGVSNLSKYPHIYSVDGSINSIGIEDVRKMRSFLKQKTTGDVALRRAIMLSDAQNMTNEAQNALLKTLEEPPADTVIVLTANGLTEIAPTIRSRLQLLYVLAPEYSQIEEYFIGRGQNNKAIQQAYYMSEGRMGIMSSLVGDSSEHYLIHAIAEAKQFITLSSHERLLRIDELSKDKERLWRLLLGLERVAVSGLHQAADKENAVQTKKFYKMSRSISDAQQLFKQNVNTKLILSQLFMVM